MTEESWPTVLENTHKAVRDYARIEFEALARRVIHRLRRMNASGIFGDDYIYKTLWDEYCHEVQEGPHELLESAWELTIRPFMDDVVDHVPHHAAVLLSIFAAWELDDDDPNIAGSVWSDGILRVLQHLVAAEAAMRSLHHLGPWRKK